MTARAERGSNRKLRNCFSQGLYCFLIHSINLHVQCKTWSQLTLYQHLLVSMFSLFFLFLALHHPVLVMGKLNGVEACENHHFNQFQCRNVGGGFCCIWEYNDGGNDNGNGQCRSNIGRNVCTKSKPVSLSLSSINMTKVTQVNFLQIGFPTQSAHSLEYKPMATKYRSQAEIGTETPTHPPSHQPYNTIFKKCAHLGPSREYLSCLGFSNSDIKLNVVISKISGMFSILGSTYVIQDVLRDPLKRTDSTFCRLMVGLSVSDIISSFIFFLGTWILPKGENVFAIGSNTSCIIGGFFLSVAILSTPLYNCSLVTFYLLQIRFQWVSRRIRDFEKWLHIVPWMMGLIAATFWTILQKIGPSLYACR